MDRHHGDLQKFITAYRAARKPSPKGLMFPLLEQMADVLAYPHNPRKVAEDGSLSHSVVYGDLRPANSDEQRRLAHRARRLWALQGLSA